MVSGKSPPSKHLISKLMYFLFFSLQGNYHQWFKDWDENKGRWGADSISKYPITFHYVLGEEMKFVDWLIYNVHLWRGDSLVVNT